MFVKKVYKSIARRKILNLTYPTLSEAGMTAESSTSGRISVKRKMTFIEEKSDGNYGDKEDGFDLNHGDAEGNDWDIHSDYYEEINTMSKIKDNWKYEHWHDFMDNEDDDEYYQRLLWWVLQIEGFMKSTSLVRLNWGLGWYFYIKVTSKIMLFKRYKVYMTQSSLCNMKKLVIEQRYHERDESHSELPTYSKCMWD